MAILLGMLAGMSVLLWLNSVLPAPPPCRIRCCLCKQEFPADQARHHPDVHSPCTSLDWILTEDRMPATLCPGCFNSKGNQ